jgi:hypothetical protein
MTPVHATSVLLCLRRRCGSPVLEMSSVFPIILPTSLRPQTWTYPMRCAPPPAIFRQCICLSRGSAFFFAFWGLGGHT